MPGDIIHRAVVDAAATIFRDIPAFAAGSEIEALFKDWLELELEAIANPDCSIEEEEEYHSRRDPVQNRLLSMPASTLREACIKAVVDTYFGAFGLDKAVLSEVCRLAGTTPPLRSKADGDTEIDRLFRDLIAAKKASGAPELDMDDPAYDVAFRHMMDVERKIMSASVTSVRDLAIQIVTADDDGDMSLNTAQVALAQAARRIVGIPCGMLISTVDIPPQPAAETEIARLYAEWRILWTESCSDDDEANRRAEYRFSIEDRAAVMPVHSVRDLAMKVLMASQNGEEGMFPAVAEELRAIANAHL